MGTLTTTDTTLFGDRTSAGIAARLKISRDVLGFSQKEFADNAEITRTNYNHAETGRHRPSVNISIKLRDTYGLTLDWIYLGDVGSLQHRLAEAIKKAHIHRNQLKGQRNHHRSAPVDEN